MNEPTDPLEAYASENRELVHVISHDLREPLRMVTSYMELFSSRYGGELDEAADEFIQYALDGARRAELMLDGLLEYSRVVNGELKYEAVGINDVLQPVVARLRVAYPDVAFDFESSSMPVVSADRKLLQQLWRHLLDNAVKFRDPQRPLTIAVDASRSAGRWTFQVVDNGIGFEARFADRIFGVFRSLHPIGRYPGVGIGLAVCRRIVDRLGGRIQAEAAPGEGAVFSFTLPAD